MHGQQHIKSLHGCFSIRRNIVTAVKLILCVPFWFCSSDAASIFRENNFSRYTSSSKTFNNFFFISSNFGVKHSPLSKINVLSYSCAFYDKDWLCMCVCVCVCVNGAICIIWTYFVTISYASQVSLNLWAAKFFFSIGNRWHSIFYEFFRYDQNRGTSSVRKL